MAEEATDIQMYQHQLNEKMLAEFTSLAHKHATVSYALIAVLVVVMGMAGLGGYLGLKSYQAAVTHAEQVEQTYQQTLQQYKTQLDADNAERVRLEQQIVDRDKQISQKKKEVAQNTTDPIKAVSNLDDAYHGTLNLDSSLVALNGRIEFTIPQVNTFTQTKLDKDALEADNKDLQTQVQSLQLDLSKGQDALKACDGTVNAYKKAAKKSKWQKIVSGMKIGAAIAIAGFLGHVI